MKDMIENTEEEQTFKHKVQFNFVFNTVWLLNTAIINDIVKSCLNSFINSVYQDSVENRRRLSLSDIVKILSIASKTLNNKPSITILHINM